MKLAPEDTLEHKDFERFSRKADMEKFYRTLVWDLRINTYQEHLPERIQRCLQITQLSAKEAHRHLPRFLHFSRRGTNIYL